MSSWEPEGVSSKVVDLIRKLRAAKQARDEKDKEYVNMLQSMYEEHKDELEDMVLQRLAFRLTTVQGTSLSSPFKLFLNTIGIKEADFENYIPLLFKAADGLGLALFRVCGEIFVKIPDGIDSNEFKGITLPSL